MKQKTFFQLSTITLACAALMACSSSSSDSPAKPSSEAQLQQQLDNAKTKLAKVKQQLSVAQADVNQHQQSLTQTSQQLTQTKQQLTKAQSDVKQLANTVSAKKAEVSRLTQEMAELVEVQKLGNSNDIQQKLSQTQQALVKANSSLSEAQNQLTNAEKQSASLKQTVAELESKKKSLSTQITQKQTQLSQLTAQVTAAEQALDKEKSQLKQLTPDNPIVEAHTEENYMGDQYKWRSIKFDESGGIEQGSISQNIASGEGHYSHFRPRILVPDPAGTGTETEYRNFADIDFSKYSVNPQQIHSQEQFAQTCASKVACNPTDKRKIAEVRFVNQTYSTYFIHTAMNYYSHDDKYHPGSPNMGYIFKELPQDNNVWARPSDQAIVTYQGRTLGYLNNDSKTPAQGDITLKANFADNTVSGTVTNRSGYKNNQDIVLIKTPISEQGTDRIGFSGRIQYGSYDANRGSDGSYEGVFVGPKAEEVVGFIESPRYSSISDGKQVFGASSK
ncbi:factor H binding protein domain-containing protein [Gallibacterium anatis]|uniref:factor H binding protein domain-containing protein n=1 Tax=Gallibacterium anatis TaxID=750 RepID=UPI00254AE4E5|nr:factor H binding protein domain-containing protein [Gallibacterium anatis]WIM82907.1 transferrin-binding protein-like solute binding protein [Gallibacterium anatis]